VPSSAVRPAGGAAAGAGVLGLAMAFAAETAR
jgi:hypothetical protein